MLTIEKEQEINNLIDYATDSIKEKDYEVAEEFLADVAYLIIQNIPDKVEQEKYASKLPINPLDYAK